MTMTEQLLTVATRYSEITNLALATVATRAGNDGGLFRRLNAGGTITVRRWEEVMRWFALHWPDGSDYPAELQPYAAGRFDPDLPKSDRDGCDGDHAMEVRP